MYFHINNDAEYASLNVGEIADLLVDLKQLYTEHPSSSLIITATRSGGVMVSGHSYANETFDGKIVLEVVNENNNNNSEDLNDKTIIENNEEINNDDGLLEISSQQNVLDVTTEAIGSSLALAETDDDVTVMGGLVFLFLFFFKKNKLIN